MDKFFIPELALENAHHAIVSKFRTDPVLDIATVLRQGLGYYEEEVMYPNDELQENRTTGKCFICHNVRVTKRRVYTILWHLLPFLRKMAAYEGLYISEHTDWSQWVAYYDLRRQGTWLYMPEMPAEQLEVIETFELFGEFPT